MQQNYSTIIVAVIIFILLGAAVYWFAFFTPGTDSLNQVLQNQENNTNLNNPEKSFVITAKNFSFSPSEIRVNQGDKVKISLNNTEGFHDWSVDEFNAKTAQIQAPSSAEIEFTVDKVGTFEFYCSVGDHRELGMVGTLIVQGANSSNFLDLSGQNLTELPAYVLGMTDLEELNISGNKLKGAFPAEIKSLTNLKILDASNNLMTGLPAEIGQMSNLEILDLSNNKLTGLPRELGDLKNLRILDISENNYSEQDLTVIMQGLPSTINIVR